MSFVSHVECTVCEARHDPKRVLTACEQCGRCWPSATTCRAWPAR